MGLMAFHNFHIKNKKNKSATDRSLDSLFLSNEDKENLCSSSQVNRYLERQSALSEHTFNYLMRALMETSLFLIVATYILPPFFIGLTVWVPSVYFIIRQCLNHLESLDDETRERQLKYDSIYDHAKNNITYLRAANEFTDYVQQESKKKLHNVYEKIKEYNYYFNIYERILSPVFYILLLFFGYVTCRKYIKKVPLRQKLLLITMGIDGFGKFSDVVKVWMKTSIENNFLVKLDCFSPNEVPLDVDITVPIPESGTNIAIVGPSGCGKTTLLWNIYREYDSPFMGVPSGIQIEFPVSKFFEMDKEGAVEVCFSVEEQEEFKKNDVSITSLSHGQQQRLSIILAVNDNKADIYLFDEYISGLEKDHKILLHTYFVGKMKAQKKRCIFVLHEQELVDLCDAVYSVSI